MKYNNYKTRSYIYGIVIILIILFSLLSLSTTSKAQLVQLEPQITTASRGRESVRNSPNQVTVFDKEFIQNSPATTIDGILASSPDFSLFRRDSSFASNPTTQGVSLRGMGPSGASRSLILLDGLPLNDPFGGWITWSAVPRLSLSSIELISEGGGSAWGNSALSGVVQLFSDDPSTADDSLNIALGSFSTRSAEFEVAQSKQKISIELLGNLFSTQGYKIVSPKQVGQLDRTTSSRHEWFKTRFKIELAEGLTALFTAQTFTEKRNNGTPYQTNATRKDNVTLLVADQNKSQFSWDLNAYIQNGNFSSTYSAVNALRSLETPTSSQYSVPSKATGAAFTTHWISINKDTTTLGLDFRKIQGETRENYLYSNGTFLNNRVAGGAQNFIGIFIQEKKILRDNLYASYGLRYDTWCESDGHLRNIVISSASVIDDNKYNNSRGKELSPSLGFTWQANNSLRFRMNAEHSFRVPTLNELYRPFTQGSNTTLANQALKIEHALNTEIGFSYILGKTTIGLSGFYNTINNAVNAVTIFKGPGIYPGLGTISATGTVLKRYNLDSIHVQGIDYTLNYKLNNAVKFNLAYLLINTLLDKSSIAPSLIGKNLVQVPKSNLTADLHVMIQPRFYLYLDAHLMGKQFVDDQNSLPLKQYTTLDLGLNYMLRKNSYIYLNLDNLSDTEIQTGLSSSGLVNIGSPRSITTGLRLSF